MFTTLFPWLSKGGFKVLHARAHTQINTGWRKPGYPEKTVNESREQMSHPQRSRHSKTQPSIFRYGDSFNYSTTTVLPDVSDDDEKTKQNKKKTEFVKTLAKTERSKK